MTKTRRKSLVGWIDSYSYMDNFKWQAKKDNKGNYYGFKEIIFPETREREVGIFNTKVRITIEELPTKAKKNAQG